MKISEALRTGAAELMANKLRTFLSFVAISIGTASFMYTFSMISGSNKRLNTALDLAGPGMMDIEIKEQYNVISSDNSQQDNKITYQDVQAIRREMPWLYMVSPSVSDNSTVRHNDISGMTSIVGITPDWAKRNWVYKLRGRFLNDYDVNHFNRVCVLMEEGDWPIGKPRPWWASFWSDNRGAKIKNHVKHADLLGQYITIGEHSYQVVGIIKDPPKGQDPRWFNFAHQEGTVLVPITSYQRYIEYNNEAVEHVAIDTGNENTVESAKRMINILLKARHGGQMNPDITSMQEYMKEQISEMRKNALNILSVGVVAILAGGIGIMNVMLATVFSRIKEIGIRRALGASKLDIVSQFVVEAMLMGLAGGVLGVGFGFLMIRYMNPDSQNPQIFIWWVPFASLLIAIATSFIFSIYPAYTAAKLDPVEALRYE
jgi:putative ABC transport system permease protein